ncbi:MAG: hypothetical protein ACRD4U_05245 [Candidatus Acidiferrales bacterium]
MTQCSAPMLALAINPNNRIADAGFTYDAAGNLTNYPGSGSYTGVYPERAARRAEGTRRIA